jgi:hypothetical protein
VDAGDSPHRDGASSSDCARQFSAFVREHSQHGQTVPLKSTSSINPFENAPLLVVDGWQ